MHFILLQIWMDELGFYVPSTVFQSFRDDPLQIGTNVTTLLLK